MKKNIIAEIESICAEHGVKPEFVFDGKVFESYGSFYLRMNGKTYDNSYYGELNPRLMIILNNGRALRREWDDEAPSCVGAGHWVGCEAPGYGILGIVDAGLCGGAENEQEV